MYVGGSPCCVQGGIDLRIGRVREVDRQLAGTADQRRVPEQVVEVGVGWTEVRDDRGIEATVDQWVDERGLVECLDLDLGADLAPHLLEQLRLTQTGRVREGRETEPERPTGASAR